MTWWHFTFLQYIAFRRFSIKTKRKYVMPMKYEYRRYSFFRRAKSAIYSAIWH